MPDYRSAALSAPVLSRPPAAGNASTASRMALPHPTLFEMADVRNGAINANDHGGYFLFGPLHCDNGADYLALLPTTGCYSGFDSTGTQADDCAGRVAHNQPQRLSEALQSFLPGVEAPPAWSSEPCPTGLKWA